MASVGPAFIAYTCRDALLFAFARTKRGGFRGPPQRDGRARSEFVVYILLGAVISLRCGYAVAGYANREQVTR